MVSGFVANEDQFEEVRSRTKHLKDIEIKEKSVMFYFSRIGKTEQCIKFRVDQETAVRKAKPAFIRVYDYYDTGKSETLTYNFSSLQCGTSKKKTVGENMKQLEKSAEKALEREEKLVEKILSLQNKYKTTEARFEYGEMNITKLNQRIDDIEDEIYREKLKIKKSADELDDTFDDMLANY